jgi:hypothetical protein
MLDFLLNPWTIFGAGLTASAVFAAVWFLLPGVIPAFLATKFGQRVAVIGGAVAALWLSFVAVAKRSERKAEQRINEQIKQDSIQRDQKREQRDAELKTLDDAALRKRASRWMSDD